MAIMSQAARRRRAFGFWALSLDQRPADKTTTSMVTYLLQIQGVARQRDRKPDSPRRRLEDGHWQASCRRAPMQASLIGDTVLVLMGLEKYATPEQRPQRRRRHERRRSNGWPKRRCEISRTGSGGCGACIISAVMRR